MSALSSDVGGGRARTSATRPAWPHLLELGRVRGGSRRPTGGVRARRREQECLGPGRSTESQPMRPFHRPDTPTLTSSRPRPQRGRGGWSRPVPLRTITTTPSRQARRLIPATRPATHPTPLGSRRLLKPRPATPSPLRRRLSGPARSGCRPRSTLTSVPGPPGPPAHKATSPSASRPPRSRRLLRRRPTRGSRTGSRRRPRRLRRRC